MRLELDLREMRSILEEVWWEGHRDVCNDCCCPPTANPYNTTKKEA
jgi:hypothetical protein